MSHCTVWPISDKYGFSNDVIYYAKVWKPIKNADSQSKLEFVYVVMSYCTDWPISEK